MIVDSEATSKTAEDGRWRTLSIVILGSGLMVLDLTVVNLALPSLRRDFDLGEGVEWVVTAYVAAAAIMQTTSGWAAGRFGLKRTFVAALTAFTVASLACAAATTFGMLVAARVAQGIGGGLLMPIGMALVYDAFPPEERGRAMGYMGIAVSAAPALGPVVGGALVSAAGWRWVFLINLPLGLVAIPLAQRILRDRRPTERSEFDAFGFGLVTVSLPLLLVGLGQGGSWGWDDTRTLSFLAVGGLLMAVFVAYELRAGHPLVMLRLFNGRVFTIGMIVIALSTIAQYARLIYIPLQLGSVRDISEFHIGLAMLPSAVGMAIMMPIGGRLTDKIGARVPSTIGLIMVAATFVGLAQLTLTSSLTTVGVLLFVSGLGLGLSMMAPNIVALNSVESKLVSQASGLSSATRQISSSLSTAVLVAVFATAGSGSGTGADQLIPYRAVFWTAVGVSLVSVLLAQLLPGRSTAHALQQARRSEAAGPIATFEAAG